MKQFKIISLLFALILAMAISVPAFAGDGSVLSISGTIQFVGDDIYIVADVDDDGEISDEEFVDGQEVVVAPASAFRPSDYEDGDEIALVGILTEDGTFQAIAVVEDADDDGFGWDDDCDDTDPDVNPDAEEIAGDGIDNDCDGEVDEVDVDEDGDGFFAGEDCDDLDPAVNPDAEEDVTDGIDNNCNDLIDEVDADGDGFYALEVGTDCDDTDPLVYPGATEDPTDGIDNDCDGETDETEEEESACRDTHPVAEALSEEYGVSVSEIMAIHCSGVGFGNIARDLGDGESLGTVMGNAPTAEEREEIRAEREAERQARVEAREAARAEREEQRNSSLQSSGGGSNGNSGNGGGGSNGNSGNGGGGSNGNSGNGGGGSNGNSGGGGGGKNK